MSGSPGMAEGEERIIQERIGQWSVQGMKCGRSATSAVRVPVCEAATQSIMEKVGSEMVVSWDLQVKKEEEAVVLG